MLKRVDFNPDMLTCNKCFGDGIFNPNQSLHGRDYLYLNRIIRIEMIVP